MIAGSDGEHGARPSAIRHGGACSSASASRAPMSKRSAQPPPHGRERLASEALRPAAASELWQERLADADFGAHADAAMQNIAVIEAANAEEEALAIAVALREAVRDAGQDRGAGDAGPCARPPRAGGAGALERAGRRLRRRCRSPIRRPACSRGSPREAALDGARAGAAAGAAQASAAPSSTPPASSTLERAILRGPRPKRGTAGLARCARRPSAARSRTTAPKKNPSLHHSDPRLALTDAELDAAAALVAAAQGGAGAAGELAARPRSRSPRSPRAIRR